VRYSKQFLYRTSNRSFQLYWKDVCRAPLLSTDEEVALVKMINCNNDEARQRLIKANLRLVVAVALRFSDGGHLSFLDLVQAGNIGLIRAADTFDHRGGFKFSAYAWSCIFGEIYRAVVGQARAIRVPEYIFTDINKFRRAEVRLTQELGRVVTSEEVITAMGGLPDSAYCAMKMTQDLISLDAFISGDDDENNDRTLHDFTPAKDVKSPIEVTSFNFLRENIGIIMSELNPRQKCVIEMRFGLNDGLNRTLEDIGREFGLTRERIRQIEIKALKKIRRTIKRYKLEGLREYVP